ncbi:unnamed protein product [Amoebophrya sp. A120]|nr:unnamed protein product [Amoebophrya sp. A120]|eukprot:GSA120T00012362001.1
MRPWQVAFSPWVVSIAVLLFIMEISFGQLHGGKTKSVIFAEATATSPAATSTRTATTTLAKRQTSGAGGQLVASKDVDDIQTSPAAPSWEPSGFALTDEARAFLDSYVQWYNDVLAWSTKSTTTTSPAGHNSDASKSASLSTFSSELVQPSFNFTSVAFSLHNGIGDCLTLGRDSFMQLLWRSVVLLRQEGDDTSEEKSENDEKQSEMKGILSQDKFKFQYHLRIGRMQRGWRTDSWPTAWEVGLAPRFPLLGYWPNPKCDMGKKEFAEVSAQEIERQKEILKSSSVVGLEQNKESKGAAPIQGSAKGRNRLRVGMNQIPPGLNEVNTLFYLFLRPSRAVARAVETTLKACKQTSNSAPTGSSSTTTTFSPPRMGLHFRSYLVDNLQPEEFREWEERGEEWRVAGGADIFERNIAAEVTRCADQLRSPFATGEEKKGNSNPVIDPPDCWFVTVDSVRVADMLKKRFPDKVILTDLANENSTGQQERAGVSRISGSEGNGFGRSQAELDEMQSQAKRAYTKMFADWFTLREMPALAVSEGSYFSATAAKLRDVPLDKRNTTQICSISPCAQATLDVLALAEAEEITIAAAARKLYDLVEEQKPSEANAKTGTPRTRRAFSPWKQRKKIDVFETCGLLNYGGRRTVDSAVQAGPPGVDLQKAGNKEKPRAEEL